MTTTDIINCIVSVIGVLISISAIIISCNATRRQTKIDLFNKRYDFFIACDTICACCIINMPNIIEARLELLNIEFTDYTFGSSRFLFNKETSDLILSIYSKGMAFNELIYYLSVVDSEEAKKDIDFYNHCISEKEKSIEFFKSVRIELSSKFNKYLKL